MTSLTVGDLVGERYRILRFAGEGGMQEVYQSYDQTLQRVVALKTPKNSSARKRFQASAAASARITHPNVAKTYDYLTIEGRQFLVEEFVEGRDLGDALEKEFFHMDPHLAAHVFHHLIKGLEAVHRVGVFHRDLKPTNIIVSVDPNLRMLKITDFGIAKMTEVELEEAFDQGESSIAASETVVGALPYMAPELIEDHKSAGIEADIWSAGAMLYQLLSGERPFGAGIAATAKILSAELPKRGSLHAKASFKTLDDELWSMIETCLQRDPSRRPTAEQLAIACAELCYSVADRQVGYVQNYQPKGYGQWGYINTEDDSHFYHVDSYYGGKPVAGQRVHFSVFDGDPSPRAFPVLPVRN